MATTQNQLNQANLDYARSLLSQGQLTQMYDYLASQEGKRGQARFILIA